MGTEVNEIDHGCQLENVFHLCKKILQNTVVFVFLNLQSSLTATSLAHFLSGESQTEQTVNILDTPRGWKTRAAANTGLKHAQCDAAVSQHTHTHTHTHTHRGRDGGKNCTSELWWHGRVGPAGRMKQRARQAG